MSDTTHASTPGPSGPKREPERRKRTIPRRLRRAVAGDRVPSGGLSTKQRRFIRAYRVRSSAGTALLASSLLILALTVLYQLLPGLPGPFVHGAFGGSLLAALGLMTGALLVPAVVIVVTYRLGNRRVAGLHTPSVSLLAMAALCGIPFALIAVGLSNLTALLMLRLGMRVRPYYTFFAFTPETVRDYVLLLTVAALLPALIEEVFFRGLLQSALQLTGRRNLAMLLQATAFAFYYPWGLALPAAFGMGLFLGYLRKRCDALGPAVLARLFMNLTIFGIHYLLPVITSTDHVRGNRGRSYLYASAVAAAIAVMILLPVLLRLIALNDAEIRQQDRRTKWLGAHRRVLVPVQDVPAPESRTHTSATTARALREAEMGARESGGGPGGSGPVVDPYDPYMLPQASRFWAPSDWKFNVGLVLLLLLMMLRR